MNILPDETLEELDREGLRIIQKRKGFRFGTDSILLADFATVRRGDRVGDFGTGSAILPLIMSTNAPDTTFEAWEIQPEIAQMAARTVALNGLTDRINVRCADARGACADIGYGKLDMIVCNPPYYRTGTAIPSEAEDKRISKHGGPHLLEELMESASKVLKFGGHICLVYPADGIVDLMCAMRTYKLEPKCIRMVHSRLSKPPILVLAEGVHGGKPMARMLPPLALTDENGDATPELRAIYRMDDAAAQKADDKK